MASGVGTEFSGVMYAELVTLRLPVNGKCSDVEFAQLCELNPELDFERNADGSVVIMTPAFGDSGRRSGQAYGQLFIWANLKGGGGETFDAATGYALPNGAIRAPDASWVQSSRWNALSEEQQGSYIPLAPDFVVEVRSQSDPIGKLREKMREYIDQGVRLGWLIDPKTKSAEVYRPHQSVHRLEKIESLAGDPELPGFVLDLRVIWARQSHG